MGLLHYRPLILMTIVALPAGAVAASVPVPHQASVAAVVLWLAGLGWGFHAMLRHRLAAEDCLARLETDVVLERDARAAQQHATHEGTALLVAEWARLEACLASGETRALPARVQAVQACIDRLQRLG